MEPIVFVILLVVACVANYAAYRNGVNDGAGAVFEPWNPGYYKARQYLKKHNMKMWNLDVFKEEDELCVYLWHASTVE